MVADIINSAKVLRTKIPNKLYPTSTRRGCNLVWVCFIFLSGCSNFSASSLFSPATPTAPAVAPLTLMPQRSALLGEYRFNEGAGTVAYDSSGSGNTATIVGPTWEGNQDLNFSALNEYVQVPVALNQTNTWQFAIYSPPFGAATLPQAPAYGGPTSWGQNPSLLCGTDASHTCLIATSFYGFRSQRFMAYNSSSTESSQTLTPGWHIVTFVNGQSGALDHWYYDGKEVSGYVAQGTGGLTHPATGNYQIGGSSQYTGTWWLGKLAAAWAWSTSLPSTDVSTAATSALAFVKSKGVGTTFSPAIAAQPLIIGGIDSRTAGVGISLPSKIWLANLSLTNASYTTLNLGIPGATLFDRAIMFSLMDAQYINTQPVIEVIWGGINDFAPASGAQAAASMQSMVTQAKAAGAKVIVATEIDATGYDTKKNNFNAIIRTQALSAWGADNVADLGTVPQLGADGASASLTYFNDGLHPTDAGELLITPVMNVAINELLGSTLLSPTVTSAATYQELAGDRFMQVTGASPQVTLPTCVGLSLTRQIVNSSSTAATILTLNSEVMTGSNTVAVGVTAIFTPVPGAGSTGGCSWARTL